MGNSILVNSQAALNMAQLLCHPHLDLLPHQGEEDVAPYGNLMDKYRVNFT